MVKAISLSKGPFRYWYNILANKVTDETLVIIKLSLGQDDMLATTIIKCWKNVGKSFGMYLYNTDS